jgi:hypothetical protein
LPGLAWIKGDPHRWKTFVSNKVTQIQDIVNPERWYHIESSQNPAVPNPKPDGLSEVPEAKEHYLVALKV